MEVEYENKQLWFGDIAYFLLTIKVYSFRLIRLMK